MALRKLILISLLLIGFNSFGQYPMYKLIAKKASGCSYLLDQYSGAAAAYSLRKLDVDYAGSAIRVRRSSDNTEQDIGFTGTCGDLDTASLKTFVGTGGTDDGFIVGWYDQSGNSRNLLQGTVADQPKIMDNGVVLRSNNLPNIVFDDANTESLAASFSISQPYSIFSAATIPTSSTGNVWYQVFDGVKSGGGDGVPGIYYKTGITEQALIYSGTVLGDNTVRSGRALSSAIFNGASSLFYYNGTSIASGNAGSLGSQSILLGINWSTSIYNNSKQYEVIIWASDQSANRSGIESNINAYWQVY